MRHVRYSSGVAGDELREALDESGYAHVSKLGDERNLLSLAREFGEIIEPGVGMPTQAHDGRVYSVEARKSGQALTDAHGNLILSSTNLAFPLHTDGYNRPTPPRCVFLLRTDNSSEKTSSYIADSRIALKFFGAGLVEVLREPIFPSARGPVALLESRDCHNQVLRFNQQEIDQWASRDGNPALEDRAQLATSELARLLEVHQEGLALLTGDCLVIDNARACHGRAAMVADSKRVLKRVWVA